MIEPVRIPETQLIAMARARGFALDEARAAALRPLLESLLSRLARFAEILPRAAAPPPLGPLPDREP